MLGRTFTQLVVALLTAIAPLVKADAADHFILTQIATLAIQRMDPIVSPNGVSGHVHQIFGGSNFNQNLNTPAEQQQSKCSTTIIQADKSNYWVPLLYYRNPNNTLSPVLGGARAYYFTKTTDIKPFPPGLRMISGLAMSRNLSAPQTQGLMLSCDHGLQTPWLPNSTNSPNGCTAISLGIHFPSCGLATGDLDSEDHISHMAFPIDSGGGNTWTMVNGDKCPDSHPIKYPTIFLEANFYLSDDQPWRNEENLIMLSNGDTTGNTFHADFYNGWDQEVLTETLAQCGLGKGPQDQLQNCAPLNKSLSQQNMLDCRYENKIVDEDVGLYRPIDKLPGCNPIWTLDQPTKPTCNPAPSTPGFVYPNAAFYNLGLQSHWPMAFPFNFNIDTITDTFFPSLGASQLKPWGLDGSDQSSLHVGTLEEVIDNMVGGDATVPAPKLNPIISSSKSSTSTKSTAKPIATSTKSTAKPTSTKLPAKTTTSVKAKTSAPSVDWDIAVPPQGSSSARQSAKSTVSAEAVATSAASSGKKAKTCSRKRNDSRSIDGQAQHKSRSRRSFNLNTHH